MYIEVEGRMMAKTIQKININERWKYLSDWKYFL